jgi:hypothetical protein
VGDIIMILHNTDNLNVGDIVFLKNNILPRTREEQYYRVVEVKDENWVVVDRTVVRDINYTMVCLVNSDYSVIKV